jgi:hypothetical protein
MEPKKVLSPSHTCVESPRPVTGFKFFAPGKYPRQLTCAPKEHKSNR